MNHRPAILPEKTGQLDFAEKFLTGSQAKTAFAIRHNAEQMIKQCPGGIESIGFLTLTVGDPGRFGFEQVKDSAEANRRINNLSRRLLPTLFERWITVTERHKSGAIHFHILGVLKNFPDIRTGLDFAAIAKGDYRSAPARLRHIWRFLRENLPGYGFGRAELLPVRKTGEAIASYVSKYIEKNVYNRLKADAYKKLVRYGGWEKSQLKPNEFAWGSARAIAWRCKARALAGLVNIFEPEQAFEVLGRSWAWKLTQLWRRTLGDDLEKGFNWTWRERELLRAELYRENPGFASRADNLKIEKFAWQFDEVINDWSIN